MLSSSLAMTPFDDDLRCLGDGSYQDATSIVLENMNFVGSHFADRQMVSYVRDCNGFLVEIWSPLA